MTTFVLQSSTLCFFPSFYCEQRESAGSWGWWEPGSDMSPPFDYLLCGSLDFYHWLCQLSVYPSPIPTTQYGIWTLLFRDNSDFSCCFPLPSLASQQPLHLAQQSLPRATISSSTTLSTRRVRILMTTSRSNYTPLLWIWALLLKHGSMGQK